LHQIRRTEILNKTRVIEVDGMSENKSTSEGSVIKSTDNNRFKGYILGTIVVG